MRYMLDTDIASYVSRGAHPSVERRLAGMGPGDVCISAITRCEMLYGVEVSPRRDRDAALVRGFLAYIHVLDYPAAAAEDYALIRGELKRQGKLIGPNDFLLAAHARHLGLIFVTNNTREFARVPGLTIENWTEEPRAM